jgi:PIN domain nuclease of toxin-antitoxin system
MRDQKLGIGSIVLWEITPEICTAMLQLDFESDPADELIAATSLAYRVPLVIRDEKILRSKVVPLLRA